jgi:hypothetical protein
MPINPLSTANLDSYLDSIEPFINSLFDSDVRTQKVVVDAAQSNRDVVSFADPASRKIILESWLAAWKVTAKADPGPYFDYIRPYDQQLIDFLAGYIESWNLSLCTRKLDVSSLTSDPKASGIPFYKLTGYTARPFIVNGKWSFGTFDANGVSNGDGTVAAFLWLLFHGAHFVVPNNDGAQPPMQRFDKAFDAAIKSSDRSACPGDSHYGHAFAGADEYYLDVDDDVPESKPFFLALLVGDTAGGDDANGFLQLEGWQAQGEHGIYGGPRHSGDLAIHEHTIWNISTYGASAYSEKRCTPVFLARSAFKLHIDSATHMPKYKGAETPQSWMEPGFITAGALDEILADVHDNIGHYYIFQRSLLIHYDPVNRKPHDGYPKSIESIFPGLSAGGFDADIAAA